MDIFWENVSQGIVIFLICAGLSLVVWTVHKCNKIHDKKEK